MRLELKGDCLANGDGCYTPTKTFLTLSSFLNTLTVTLGPREVCRSDPLVWGADSEEIIKWTGTSLEGGACGFTHIDKAAVSVLLSSLHACYSDSWCFPCFLVCIEFFQADCWEVFNQHDFVEAK